MDKDFLPRPIDKNGQSVATKLKKIRKIKTFKVSVNWDTDGQDVDLPKIVELPYYLKEGNYNIADYLSDQYGWCVNSYIEL